MAKITYFDDIRDAGSISLPWEKLSNSNILITGATGLIGSCLVEVLMERPNRDYQVYALGRNSKRMEFLFNKYSNAKGFHIVLADVTQPLSLDSCFHYIIHAASGASPGVFTQHPVEVMTANLSGVKNLIDYGRTHLLRRFLYVSSGEIYGEGDGRIFTEDYSGYVNPINPRSCYPSSKRAAETLCVSYTAEYGIDTVIVRPCHIYGPNFTENDNRVYAQFIRNVINGEDIILKSTGEQLRSWCYVVDCVAALLYVLFNGETAQAYNVADSKSNITIKELAGMIADLGGRDVYFDSASSFEKSGYNTVKQSVFSTAKLERLGWNPIGSMREKIERTIDERKRRYT